LIEHGEDDFVTSGLVEIKAVQINVSDDAFDNSAVAIIAQD